MPKRSSFDLNAICPYHASVMKAFDMTSRTTVEIPLNIYASGLKIPQMYQKFPYDIRFGEIFASAGRIPNPGGAEER